MTGRGDQSVVSLTLDAHGGRHVAARCRHRSPARPVRQHLIADDDLLDGDIAAPRQHQRAGHEAGARAGPERTFVGPAGVAGGKLPEPAASEEVVLGVAPEIVRVDVLDGPAVDLSVEDDAEPDEVPEDMDGCFVELVVIGARRVGEDGGRRSDHDDACLRAWRAWLTAIRAKRSTICSRSCAETSAERTVRSITSSARFASTKRSRPACA